MQDGKITFDNPEAVYYPGQNITGRVEYLFDKVKKVRSIYIKFKGVAHTSWTEKEEERTANGERRYRDITLTGDEQYFNTTVYLVGNKSDDTQEIPAGHHSYNFSFILPPVLPSSFDHEYGYVQYSAKSVLDRPWKFDKKCTAYFKVICHLDLNQNPSYRAPVHIQLESNFCCCCCRSGPLCVDVTAPRSGYCPGEHIPLQVAVENASGVEVLDVKVAFRQLVTFRVTSPRSDLKKEKQVLAKVSSGVAPAHGHMEKQLSIAVPPLTPSNLLGCSLIDLDYDLKVECCLSGMHLNIDGSNYITIGTVPLRDSQGGYQAAYPVLNPMATGDSYNVPGSGPYPAPSNNPYPAPGNIPYPMPGNAPYPVPSNSPYPVPGNSPYPVPGNSPYPVPSNTPYPVPGNAPSPKPHGLSDESLPLMPPPPYSEVQPPAYPSAPPEETVTDSPNAGEKIGWVPPNSTQASGAKHPGEGQSGAGAESAASSPPYPTFPPLPS